MSRRKLRPRSLKSALVAYVLAPVTVALFVFGVVGVGLVEHWIESRFREDIEIIARAIEPPISGALERGRTNSVNRALASAFDFNRVYGAYVYDSGGQLVAVAGKGAAGSPAPSTRLSRLAREGDEKGEYGYLAGRSVYSYFVPLTDSGARIIGLLQVSRRVSDVERDLATFRLQTLGGALVVLCCMAGVVLAGHDRAVGRHLKRIVESMRTVSGGARDHRAPEEGPREVAALAVTMNGMLDTISSAARQIQEHRQAELELQQRLQQQQRLAAIGHLAAGVAHELGTPMSVISGKVQQILRLSGLKPTIKRRADGIRRQIGRMEEIIRQLMDFGRGDGVVRVKVRADALIQSALAALEESGATGQRSIRVGGGSEAAPVLHADRLRLTQALTNLLRNALQASPRGAVRVSWFETEATAGLVVEDDGPGIPLELRSRVFDPFFTTKAVGQGSGLGLALAHRIVQDHGGRIEIGDSPLGGALFRIIFERDGNGMGSPRDLEGVEPKAAGQRRFEDGGELDD